MIRLVKISVIANFVKLHRVSLKKNQAEEGSQSTLEIYPSNTPGSKPTYRPNWQWRKDTDVLFYSVRYLDGFSTFHAVCFIFQEGVKQLLVMLLLDPTDHDLNRDPWPWGGEPIFRDGEFAGRVKTAAYGFSIDKHVCLGFIQNFVNGDRTQMAPVTSDWVRSVII